MTNIQNTIVAPKTIKQRFAGFGINIGLLMLSAVLFALSFPSFLSAWGFFPLAFIAIFPVFIVVHRSSWAAVPFYGAIYGFTCYALYNFWLATFHPLAILIVPTIYAGYFFVLFPALKLADIIFKRFSLFPQLLLWMAYEYLRTQGFLGYPYGNLGYSQYLFLPFIQISALSGYWIVSLFVAFPSIFIGNALKSGISGFRTYFKQFRLIALIYVILFIANTVTGAFLLKDYSDAPTWRVAMVQHNSDTWERGFEGYKRNFNILKNLSLQAIENDDPEIVFWSETAFVPGVYWHDRFRDDPDRYELVKEFVEFAGSQTVPVVTGNSDGQLGDPPVLANGKRNRVEYNSVLMYDQGGLQKIYRKTHLVPFTEHFPYEKQLPWLYNILVENDYHFWEKGNDYTVFESNGVKFSTPICFEDVFGYISREFINHGAEVIVNMTNDSWSGSEAAQMQHMAMAVFRSVENHRTMIRSANSGMTCVIDPSGRILAMLEPFTQDYLVYDVPVYTETTTVYTQWGDLFAQICTILAFLVLGGGVVARMIRRKKN